MLTAFGSFAIGATIEVAHQTIVRIRNRPIRLVKKGHIMERQPDITLRTLPLPGRDLTNVRLVHAGHYGNGSPAFDLHDDEGFYCHVTVALPDAVPAEGCIFIKDYSENVGMKNALLATGGIIRTTGRVFDAGWVRGGVVEAQIL